MKFIYERLYIVVKKFKGRFKSSIELSNSESYHVQVLPLLKLRPRIFPSTLCPFLR